METPSKTVLIVSAHPEPQSLTHFFAMQSVDNLQAKGYRILQSNLYEMDWKAHADANDFKNRIDPTRLNYIAESQHAYSSESQVDEVKREQEKLLQADAVIFHFPLWWYGMPAILKGWFDRVYAYGFAYGYKGMGNHLRFGDGVFKGKRAMLFVSTGGPAIDYSPRSINGPIDQLLFPITHGCLFYPGFSVLENHVVHNALGLSEQDMQNESFRWQNRLESLFDEDPIPFRTQNGGDFPDKHELAPHILPEKSGIEIHWK